MLVFHGSSAAVSSIRQYKTPVTLNKGEVGEKHEKIVKFLKSKGKIHPRTGHDGPEGVQRYSYTLSLTSVVDGDGWSTPRPGRFTPGERDPIPTV